MSDAVPAQSPNVVHPAVLVEMAAEVVGAYVAHNSVPPAELLDLLATVHTTLSSLSGPAPQAAAEARLVPPVSVRKSIADDYLVSMEDGKRYKALKRHLTGLGMTPAEYRAKWGLPPDYPMVSPAYARVRSELAKTMGLGAMRRKR